MERGRASGTEHARQRNSMRVRTGIKWWLSLAPVQPAKRRMKHLQQIYWKYFRPLYCEKIPMPPAKRVLVVCPHIDDDVIGCGGVLKQHATAGAKLTSVYLRDGGTTREVEANEAGKMIGLNNLIFLRWGSPDRRKLVRKSRPGMKADFRIDESTITALHGIIDQTCPDVVYAPFFLDPHPDHAAAARLLNAAMEYGTAVKACYLYEVWSPLTPNVLVEITHQAETKRRAVNAHRSQVETINMSEGILGLNAYRAQMNRIPGYAEAFLRVRPRELSQMLRDLDRAATDYG
jgi:LmbE family N-acetylglucosaminyl deacetylase